MSSHAEPGGRDRIAPSGDSLVVGAADDRAEAAADRLAAAALSAIRTSTVRPVAAVPGSAEGRVRRSTAATATATETDADDERATDANEADVDPDVDLDGELDGDRPAAEGGDRIRRSASATAGAAPGAVPHGRGGGSARPDVSDRIRRSASATAGAAPGAVPHGRGGGSAHPDVSDRIRRSRGSGSTLQPDLRRQMETGFGADLGGVRIHRNTHAAQLSRDLSAEAFTVGNDVYFGEGRYRPETSSGQELIAHELAHVVTEGSAGSARRRTVIRRKFQPVTTASKAHLRRDRHWTWFHGPAIGAGSQVFVDDAPGNERTQTRFRRADVNWKPAVSVPHDHEGAVAPQRVGYIRSGRVVAGAQTADQLLEARVRGILDGCTADATLKGLLTKPAHVAFLMRKSVQLDGWNGASPSLNGFARGLGSLGETLDRIREGADHVATTLEHWRAWLHPNATFDDVTFKESDLHEHGLGVLEVKFKQPIDAKGAKMFRGQATVEVMVKPEDKSLEVALLGDHDGSIASLLNQEANLQPGEQIGTIKMASENAAPPGSTEVWSTLVQKVAGKSAEDMQKAGDTGGKDKGKGEMAVSGAFQETLMFAFLTGMEDLHWENVMWVGQTPYLIDADTALANHQLTKGDGGDKGQNGFTTINRDETYKSIDAIKNKDNTDAQSKVFQMMLTDAGKRATMIAALKGAFAGKKGRTVPIYTARWDKLIREYPMALNMPANDRESYLQKYSSKAFLVEVFGVFLADQGPGLAGAVGTSPTNFYDHDVARQQFVSDMERKVVPFFTYEYSTGKVSWNGKHIYTGQNAVEALDGLAAYFA